MTPPPTTEGTTLGHGFAVKDPIVFDSLAGPLTGVVTAVFTNRIEARLDHDGETRNIRPSLVRHLADNEAEALA
ncbi:hypothetical protein AB0I28_32465 [Phytomonospora sp. NPDC050363]|uniref:hypothetical protein n=1 Tax=Phytomonospora sp. NPDC050363 TaxID=3155642 RepID=UPI0033D93006